MISVGVMMWVCQPGGVPGEITVFPNTTIDGPNRLMIIVSAQADACTENAIHHMCKRVLRERIHTHTHTDTYTHTQMDNVS